MLVRFIRANLSPLSFTDVPRELNTHATVGVYELNRVELLRDVFVWAYSASEPTVRVRQVQRSHRRHVAVDNLPDSGFLGHVFGSRVIVQSWCSFEHLEAYAGRTGAH